MSLFQERDQSWWWEIPTTWHNQTATHLRTEKSWKRKSLQFLYIPASSELDHFKPVPEVLFLLFCVIAQGCYIIAVVKEVIHVAVCGRESGTWHCIKMHRMGQKQLVRYILWHYLCFSHPAHDRAVRLKTWSLVTFCTILLLSSLGFMDVACDDSLFLGNNSISRNRFNNGLTIKSLWWSQIEHTTPSVKWQINIQIIYLTFMLLVVVLL